MPNISLSLLLSIALVPVLLIAALSVFTRLLSRRNNKAAPDEGWKGAFYSNPNNSALFVPKRFGIGYTLNFGNPWSWLIIALLMLLVAVPVFIFRIYLHRLPIFPSQ